MELPNDPDKHIFPDAALVEAQGWERFVREIRGRGDLPDMEGMDQPDPRLLHQYIH